MSLAELLIKIRADITQATAGFAAVNGAMTKLDKSVMAKSKSIRKTLSGLAKKFALVGAIAAAGLAIGLAKATKTFITFEQSVTNAASVTGKMGAEFDRVKEHVGALSKELGETTVFSAIQAADAMYDLASAGYDVGNMVASDLRPILDLAAATQADLKFTTETVTSTLAQFGMEISESHRVADVFAKTIGSSKATMDKLSTSMSYAGPIAKALGISLETTSASLGILYNAGLDASQGGTALRAMMQRLLLPTGGAQRALEEMGLTIEDVDVTSRSFADVLDSLKSKNMTAAQAVEIFGVRAASAALGLVANVDQLRELDASLQDAGGTAKQVAEEQLDTLGGAFTLLKSKAEGLLISVGEVVDTGLRGFTAEINSLFPTIKEFAVNGVQVLIDLLRDLGPTWESIKSVMVSVGGIIKDVGEAFGLAGEDGVTTLADTINGAAVALAKVFDWIDKHPEVTKLAIVILAVVAAFAYVLPAVVGIIGAVGSLITFVSALAAAISGATSVIGAIGAVIALLGGPITVIILVIAALAAAWATNLFGIRDKTRSAIDFIKGLWDRFVSFLTGHKDMIVNILLALTGPIGLVILAFKNWDKIMEIVTVLKNWLGDTMDTMVANAKEWGINLLKGFIDGIKSQIDNVKNTIREVSSLVKDYIGIESPSKKGPLKDLMTWGPNLTKTFAEGIASGIGDINATFGNLVEPTVTKRDMPKPTPTSSSYVVNINNPVVRDDSDIDTLARKIEAVLTNKTRGVAV